MLLLQRRRNESVVIYPDDDEEFPMVIRVCEVLPTGDVTLGFMGDGYTIIRSEICGCKEKKTMEGNKNEDSKISGYYS
mgnify:FL=1